MTRTRIETVLQADGTVKVFINGHHVFTVDSDDVLREMGQLFVTIADSRQGRNR